MNHILVIGAGRSASALINYLKENAEQEKWQIKLADFDISLAEEKAGNHPAVSCIQFDIFNSTQAKDEIAKADLVVSMLPARFHHLVAEVCVDLSKHLVTASYNNKDVAALSDIAKGQNTLILMECGLDPGIDHMTAMEVIDDVKEKNGKMLSFKSFTGGLIAPESDNNPWNYKFTWNPRNVVLAGQGTASFIRNNRYKYIPYHQLFKRLETFTFENLGDFEGYPNRDSLSYRKVYDIQEIPTLLRGTLRRPGYSKAWDVFVQLGITDDNYEMEALDQLSHRDFLNAFLKYDEHKSIEDKLCEYTGIEKGSDAFNKIAWLGLFDDKPLPIEKGSPAQVMQAIMEQKMSLSPGDKDMIVMQHKFEYEIDGKKYEKVSSIVSYGEDESITAMAKTVGLPLGIAVKNILNGNINLRGVQVPTQKEIYQPILEELTKHNISITEEEREI
jgi:saccharopine dehydrogenase (NADP+, L-glutamate forming)